MKKSSIKYLIMSCIATAVAGYMTACGENRTPNLSSSDTGSSDTGSSVSQTGTGSSDTGSSNQSGSPTAVLSSPTGLYLEIWHYYGKTDYALTWEEVEHAQSYKVTVGEKVYKTDTASCVITESVTVGENCYMEVVAIGDGVTYGNSESVEYESEIEAVTEQIRFNVILGGGSEVSKRYTTDVVQGRVVIPDRFEGAQVTKIANGAFQEDYYELDFHKATFDFRWSRYLTEIGENAFHSNAQVRNIALPESVTSIQNRAFYKCQGLENLVLPKALERLGEEAFYYCQGIKTVKIPNQIREIPEGVFDNCNFLKEITIPEGVTKVGDRAFRNCKLLTELSIPSTVTEIGNGAFSGCERLEVVHFPSGLEILWNNAFSDCIALKSVSLGEKVDIKDGAFKNCTALESIEVSEKNEKQKSVNGHLYSKDGKVLMQYALGNSAENFSIPNGVETISDRAFLYASFLESVEFSSSVIKVGNYAFSYCTNLISVTFNNGLQSIKGGAFKNCEALERIAIPPSVKTIDSIAFAECKALKELQIYDGVEKLGSRVFQKCVSLTSVEIPNSVTVIKEEAFVGCTSLSAVKIGYGVSEIGENAFVGCNALTGITVETQNVAYQSIDGNLYTKDGKTLIKYACAKTGTDFTVPNGVVKIEKRAFEGSRFLVNLQISNSVETIGLIAFYDCEVLQSVSIGVGVVTIEDNAFENCSALTDIAFQGTKAQWNAIAKGYNWTLNTLATVVHCTDGDVAV